MLRLWTNLAMLIDNCGASHPCTCALPLVKLWGSCTSPCVRGESCNSWDLAFGVERNMISMGSWRNVRLNSWWAMFSLPPVQHALEMPHNVLVPNPKYHAYIWNKLIAFDCRLMCCMLRIWIRLVMQSDMCGASNPCTWCSYEEVTPLVMSGVRAVTTGLLPLELRGIWSTWEAGEMWGGIADEQCFPYRPCNMALQCHRILLSVILDIMPNLK